MQTAGCGKLEKPLGFNCCIAVGKLNICKQPHQAGVSSSGTSAMVLKISFSLLSQQLQSSSEVVEVYDLEGIQLEQSFYYSLAILMISDLSLSLISRLQRKISIFGPFITSIKC